MFKSLGLLSNIPCPDIGTCSRIPCIFSHQPAKRVNPPSIAVISGEGHVAKKQKLSSAQPVVPKSALSKDTAAPEVASKTLSQANGSVNAQRTSTPAPKAGPSTIKPANKSTVISRTAKPIASTSKAPKTAAARPTLDLKNYSVATSHTPYAARKQMLNFYHEQFTRLYSSLDGNNSDTAILHAKEQEDYVYANSKKMTYKNKSAQTLMRLKKRECTSEFEMGTNEELDVREKEAEKRKSEIVTAGMIEKYGMSKEDVKKWEQDFVWHVPGSKGHPRTEEDYARDCSRCKKNFTVKNVLSESDKKACHHHWGKLVSEVVNGQKERLWNCCRGPTPCSFGAHVFQDYDPSTLHARQPFMLTKDFTTSKSPLGIAAVDCELIYTTAGMSLARLTICSGDKKVMLDEHVRPDPAVPLDYATRFSGIKEKDIIEATLDFEGMRKKLGELIGEETLLIGHGLDNDLKALRIIHRPDRIIDTSLLFPHPAGFRHSLRNLSKMHLGIFIQDQGYHDSKEDALIALELVKVKYDQDEKHQA